MEKLGKLGVAVMAVIIAGALHMAGGIMAYVDIMALIFVLAIAAGFAFAGSPKHTWMEHFANGAVKAGWLGFMIGVIAIFGGPAFAAGNLAGIGAAMSVASLTVLYGYAIKLIADGL